MAYGIALVPSTSHAVRGEKLLKQAGLQVKLIPTPRELSSNCGLALRFPWEAQAQVIEILRQNHIDCDRIVALPPKQP